METNISEIQLRKEMNAATYAKDHKTITDEDGKIADSGAAQEMAVFTNILNDELATPLQREMAQKAEKETEDRLQSEAFLQGLTENEHRNIEILKGLTTKDGMEINQHAFIDVTDSKGRPYRILRPVDDRYNRMSLISQEGNPGWLTFFCKDGPFRISLSNFGDVIKTADIPGMINWEVVGDIISNRSQFPESADSRLFQIPFKYKNNEIYTDASIARYNLANERDRDTLRKNIIWSEQSGIRISEETEKALPDVTTVLRDLV